MAITNYTELKAAIARWDKRTDLDSSADDFIALAEAKINRTLRVWQMEETLAATTIVNGLITRPADLVEFKSLNNTNNNKTPVEQKSLEFVLSHPSDGSIPLYYAWEEDKLRFNTNSGEVSGVYYKKVDALTSGSPTNWLLTLAPDLYLWGCLAEDFYFQMDEQRATFYDTRFNQLMAELNVIDKNARFSGNSLVARVA